MASTSRERIREYSSGVAGPRAGVGGGAGGGGLGATGSGPRVWADGTAWWQATRNRGPRTSAYAAGFGIVILLDVCPRGSERLRHAAARSVADHNADFNLMSNFELQTKVSARGEAGGADRGPVPGRRRRLPRAGPRSPGPAGPGCAAAAGAAGPACPRAPVAAPAGRGAGSSARAA